ncbi:hypothetical protein EV363DRAFT_1164973 [Boletus edulis]|uniref:MARVEL domain-containing protein n=1 Tax=Boletus edulis BED1 TaxID=1328754 RepID=A0AAD4BN83_BOLED|nr:hypothetical protein EV363DRAFT_1164973 [Boletus edulis]KAF8435707.1 hypothetical protein L210DRAFT_3613528 [Boletus edulis BED1]
MAFEDWIRKGHPIILGSLIVFSIIELSISAFLVAQFNRHHNYFSTDERDRTAFLLFASIWTIVLSALYMSFFFIVPDNVLLLTWIFWTAGAASITAALGGGLNCVNQTVFVYCGQLNALEGFAWVIWIIVTFAIIVVAIRGVIAARRGDGLRGPLVV